MLSCQFDPRGCSHHSIFLDEYKRTNRTKRTKIFRCFPHCCPGHVERSYCGSAVYVRVQHHKSRRSRPTCVPSSSAYNVLVYAHFEEASACPYNLGDQLDRSTVLQSIQTEQNPQGIWIEGILYESIDNVTDIYQINPDARWYYEWESAATKSQRFTKHVLSVYVFLQDNQSTSIPPTLRIAAIARSSEFKVVSYRRAAGEVQSERVAAILEEKGIQYPKINNLFRRTPVNVDVRRAPVNVAVCPPFEQKYQPLEMENVKRLLVPDTRQWDRVSHEVLKASKHMALLYRFISMTDAKPLQQSLTEWTLQMNKRLTKSDSNHNHSNSDQPPPSLFRWLFCDTDRCNPAPQLQTSVQVNNSELQRLGSKCARTMTWMMLDQSIVERLDQILQDATSTLIAMGALQPLFSACIILIHGEMNQFLQTHYDTTLRELVEQITSAIFRYDQYSDLRVELLDHLISSRPSGVETFVSQVRTKIVASQGCRKRCRISLQISDEVVRLVGLRGHWKFDGQHSNIIALGDSVDFESSYLSLGSVMDWMREWAAIRIYTSDSNVMYISSMWNQRTISDDAGMKLVLDGQHRIFEQLPSGLSSTIYLGDCIFGDYRGQVVGPGSVMLEFTAWPSLRTKSSVNSSNTSVHRWIFRIQARHDVSTGRTIAVDGALERGQTKKAHALASMPMQEKRTIVDEWTPIYRIKGKYVGI